MAAADVSDLERWFVEHGAPNLVEDYRQRVDVSRRARPFLGLALVIEVVAGVGDLDLRWWENTLAVLVSLGVLGVITLLRAPSPNLATLVRRLHLGALSELATFVVVPPLLTATIGTQPGQAAIFLAVNLVLVAVVYLAAGFGLVPVLRWGAGRAARELGAVIRLVGRALPLLLLIQIVLFINTEMWQVADGFHGITLGIVVGLFVATGVLFLVTRLPRELDELATFAEADEVRLHVAGTPAAPFAEGLGDLDGAPVALSRRQRLNVSLVALFSQGLQIAMVTVLVGAFFVAFGILTITPGILEAWLGHAGEELLALQVADQELRLTAELLKISTFLAAFSGLYFTVVLVTDETYRQEFRRDILAELRQTFAVLTVYRRVRDATDTSGGQAGTGTRSIARPMRSTKLSQ